MRTGEEGRGEEPGAIDQRRDRDEGERDLPGIPPRDPSARRGNRARSEGRARTLGASRAHDFDELFLHASLEVRLGEVQPQPERGELGLEKAEEVGDVGEIVHLDRHRLLRPGDGDVDAHARDVRVRLHRHRDDANARRRRDRTWIRARGSANCQEPSGEKPSFPPGLRVVRLSGAAGTWRAARGSVVNLGRPGGRPAGSSRHSRVRVLDGSLQAASGASTHVFRAPRKIRPAG